MYEAVVEQRYQVAVKRWLISDRHLWCINNEEWTVVLCLLDMPIMNKFVYVHSPEGHQMWKSIDGI